MCGICGIWGKTDKPAVERMVGAMYHRGPDDNGTFFDEKISLGMTRLAILDISRAGHQPMSASNKNIWIVYNGETYNFKSERKILESKGYQFNSASDTEVILKMYEEYGDEFLKRLRGMFALAIYDKRGGFGKERLLLARDHFGIKPLLYASVGDQIVFSSEIKTILASGLVKREIDPVGLRQLLTFGSVLYPFSIIKGVKMLPPAHKLVVENGEMKVERFWKLDIDRRPELRALPYPELVEEVRGVLEESVRLQMVSDVPVGAFLSGGIDSSLMVAMMARASQQKMKTFSVGFGREGMEIDESQEAEITANHIGTDHQRVVVTEQDVLDHIEKFAFSLDQPSNDGINTYFVSRAAQEEVTVAISGNGGDELFAGYPWFIFMQMERLKQISNPLSATIRSSASKFFSQGIFDKFIPGRAGQFIHRLRHAGGFINRFANNSWQLFGVRDAYLLLSQDLRSSARAGRSLHFDFSEMDEVPHGSTLERVSALCLRGYNSNQLLPDSDTVSMIHSLELRVPFLDPVVADTAFSLPDDAKLRTGGKLSLAGNLSYHDTGSKRILLDIGKPMLPEDFHKKPKRGFGMPFGAWLKGSLKEVYRDTLSEESVRKRGILDWAEVSRVREGFEKGKVEPLRIWTLMILELWCREVLDM
jgi:asparagine synthase (glutamine-hydrolysing)